MVTGTAALPVVEGIMGASFHSSCMVAMQRDFQGVTKLRSRGLFAQFAAVAKSLAHAHRL